MAEPSQIILVDQIEPKILAIRGHKVMLHSDLAELYGIPTKRLNEQVRRNADRFPTDFQFQLTADEADALRSQIATSKPGRGGRRYRPFVFTEYGAVMAANVVNTPRAIQVSVVVVRTFVKLRELVVSHKELAHKLSELERKVVGHDEDIRTLISAIRQLMEPPPEPPKRRRIGFSPNPDV